MHYTNIVTSIIKHQEKILLLKRSDRVKTMKNVWSGVSGIIENDDESPLSRAKIEIFEEKGKLTIKGEIKEAPANFDTRDNYVLHYGGLAQRGFTRNFNIAPNIEIKKVTLENGVLSINFLKNIDKNRNQILIPPGFANGHLVMSDFGIFSYKQSTLYGGASEQFTVKWNDPK